jgi:hypothetical protein
MSDQGLSDPHTRRRRGPNTNHVKVWKEKIWSLDFTRPETKIDCAAEWQFTRPTDRLAYLFDIEEEFLD